MSGSEEAMLARKVKLSDVLGSVAIIVLGSFPIALVMNLLIDGFAAQGSGHLVSWSIDQQFWFIYAITMVFFSLVMVIVFKSAQASASKVEGEDRSVASSAVQPDSRGVWRRVDGKITNVPR